MEYKLVAIDMDGTLLNSQKKVSERTKKAIFQAGEKGVYIILATGRILVSALKYSSNINLKRPIISSNGAIMIDENEDVIFEKQIDKNVIENITSLADKQDMYYHFYTKDSYYSNKYIEEIIEFYNPKGIKEEDKIQFNLYNNISEIIDKDIYKFIFIDNDTHKLYKLREELQKIEEINVSSSWSNNIEIMEKKVSKGNSLKLLCKKLGISRKNVIAIGDNENDISMVEFAGLGVSMGNGSKKIKSTSDIITSSNDKDGVAEIIENYIL